MSISISLITSIHPPRFYWLWRSWKTDIFTYAIWWFVRASHRWWRRRKLATAYGASSRQITIRLIARHLPRVLHTYYGVWWGGTLTLLDSTFALEPFWLQYKRGDLTWEQRNIAVVVKLETVSVVSVAVCAAVGGEWMVRRHGGRDGREGVWLRLGALCARGPLQVHGRQSTAAAGGRAGATKPAHTHPLLDPRGHPGLHEPSRPSTVARPARRWRLRRPTGGAAAAGHYGDVTAAGRRRDVQDETTAGRGSDNHLGRAGGRRVGERGDQRAPVGGRQAAGHRSQVVGGTPQGERATQTGEWVRGWLATPGDTPIHRDDSLADVTQPAQRSDACRLSKRENIITEYACIARIRTYARAHTYAQTYSTQRFLPRIQVGRWMQCIGQISNKSFDTTTRNHPDFIPYNIRTRSSVTSVSASRVYVRSTVCMAVSRVTCHLSRVTRTSGFCRLATTWSALSTWRWWSTAGCRERPPGGSRDAPHRRTGPAVTSARRTAPPVVLFQQEAGGRWSPSASGERWEDSWHRRLQRRVVQGEEGGTPDDRQQHSESVLT